METNNSKNKEPMAEIAETNFNHWNEMLQTKDPKKVAGLYSENCTFLPTLSPEFKQGEKGAEEYFHHFLEKNPFGEIVTDEVQSIDQKSYVHSGMYNFIVCPDNNRQTVEARFTYVWQLNDNKWEIIHHHSSVKPKQ